MNLPRSAGLFSEIANALMPQPPVRCRGGRPSLWVEDLQAQRRRRIVWLIFSIALETGKPGAAFVTVRVRHQLAAHREPPSQPREACFRPELFDERLPFQAVATVAPTTFDIDDRQADVPQFQPRQVVWRWSPSSQLFLRCRPHRSGSVPDGKSTGKAPTLCETADPGYEA